MRKDLRDVLKACEEYGFEVRVRTSGHAQVFTADGEFITGVACTPSEYRGWQNMLSRLKRHGLVYR